MVKYIKARIGSGAEGDAGVTCSTTAWIVVRQQFISVFEAFYDIATVLVFLTGCRGSSKDIIIYSPSHLYLIVAPLASLGSKFCDGEDP